LNETAGGAPYFDISFTIAVLELLPAPQDQGLPLRKSGGRHQAGGVGLSQHTAYCHLTKLPVFSGN
jgi:hypothetical protein